MSPPDGGGEPCASPELHSVRTVPNGRIRHSLRSVPPTSPTPALCCAALPTSLVPGRFSFCERVRTACRFHVPTSQTLSLNEMTRAPARIPPGANDSNDYTQNEKKTERPSRPAARGAASRSQTPPRRDALTAQGSGPGAPRPRHPRQMVIVDINAPEMIAATSDIEIYLLHILLRSRGDAERLTAAHEKRLGWPIGRAGLQVWSGVSPSRVHLYPDTGGPLCPRA